MLSDDVWVYFEKVEMAKGRVQQVLHYRLYVNHAGSVQIEVALQLVVKCFSKYNVMLIFQNLSKFLRQNL